MMNECNDRHAVVVVVVGLALRRFTEVVPAIYRHMIDMRDGVVLYSAVTPCYCSMLGALGRVV